MFKVLMITATAFLLLTGCDARRKDKMAGSPAIANGKADEAPLAPPTTVEIIDSVYDFGKVAEGEIVEYSYRFKNTGTNPLVVSNVSASCGCTVPEKPEAPIKPGETGFIKVKFNSEARVGVAHKSITVLSNAAPSFPQLLLKGEVTAKVKQ